MNPAALKANLAELPPGSTILVNADAFDERNLDKVGYKANPLEDGSLAAYRVIQVPMTTHHARGVQGARREAARRRALEELLRARPDLVDVHAPDRADASSGSTSGSASSRWCTTPTSPRSRPGCTSARPPSCSTTRTRSRPRSCRAGTLPQHHRQRRDRVRASSPARRRRRCRSSTRRTRSRRRPTSSTSSRSTRTSVCARCRPKTRSRPPAVAIGAAFAGQLGVTATSGPGVDLKSRGDRPRHQPRAAARARSTCSAAGRPPGCPPRPSSPTSCSRCTAATASRRCRSSPRSRRATASTAAFEAVRIALKYRTPVILLTDGYLANGAEPWLLPDVRRRCPTSRCRSPTSPNHDGEFWPYLRDPETLARPWAIPGTPGLMHRIGGIEKQEGTGNINYEPGQPRADDPHPRRQGGGHREATSRRSRSTATPTPTCSCSAGAARGARSARRCAGCAAAGQKVGARAPRAPEPVPRQPRRGAARATARCSCPR